MKLNVMERLVSQSLLPEKGNFANLKLIRVARENLSFNEEENKLLDFKEENGNIKWKEGSVPEKEIELGEVATVEIQKALKKLDDKNELEARHISLYEKFVESTQ